MKRLKYIVCTLKRRIASLFFFFFEGGGGGANFQKLSRFKRIKKKSTYPGESGAMTEVSTFLSDFFIPTPSQPHVKKSISMAHFTIKWFLITFG